MGLAFIRVWSGFPVLLRLLSIEREEARLVVDGKMLICVRGSSVLC